MLSAKSMLLAASATPFDNSPLQQHGPSALFGMSLKDLLLVIGVAMVLGLILFLWAYLTRKDRRNRTRLSRPIYRAEKRTANDLASQRLKVRRRRRRRADQLPRNPTLAEAGGLPPIREEPHQP